MFLKKFFGSGAVTIVNALRALAINKLLALFLTPAAFACVGQFLNLMAAGQGCSSLALQNGWTSLSAKNAGNEKELLGIWRGGVRITTFASIVTFAVMAMFCFMAPLEKFFPGMNPRLVQAAILFAMPGILSTNVITIISSTFVGLGENRKWALVNVTSSLWQVLWVAAFLYTGRLSVLSIIATQSVLGALFAALLARKTKFRLKYVWSTALDIRKPWFSFALMGIVPMVLSPVVLTIVRTSVDGAFGHNAAGLWQSVWKFSDCIFMVMAAVLTVTVLPAVSRAKDRAEFIKAFYPKLFFILCFSLLLVVTLFLGRNFFVPLLFSNAYLGAADFMHWQLVGDFFRTGGFAFALVLIARQEMKKFVLTEIAGETFLAVGALVGMKYFCFSAPMMAYAAENFLYFLLTGVLVWRLEWKTP